jgi:hypothetical protein
MPVVGAAAGGLVLVAVAAAVWMAVRRSRRGRAAAAGAATTAATMPLSLSSLPAAASAPPAPPTAAAPHVPLPASQGAGDGAAARLSSASAFSGDRAGRVRLLLRPEEVLAVVQRHDAVRAELLAHPHASGHGVQDGDDEESGGR